MGWRLKEDYLGYTVVAHPSRKYLVLLGCQLRVVNKNGDIVEANKIDGCGSYGAAFSKDGSRFAYQDDGKLYVGNWRNLKLENPVLCNGHTRDILEIKFRSGHNNKLFTTSDDGTTRSWEVNSNNCKETSRQRFGGYDTAITEEGMAYTIESSEWDSKSKYHLKLVDLNTGNKKVIGSYQKQFQPNSLSR